MKHLSLLILSLMTVLLSASAAVKNPTTPERLKGKIIAFIGDSYVANHKCPKSEAWHYKMAERLGMRYLNYGRNGSLVSIDSERFGKAIANRYQDMQDSIDYIVIIAGHNDAKRLDEIGGIKFFKKQLCATIKGMKKRWPKAQILMVSPWEQTDGHSDEGFREVINCEAKVCKSFNIPMLNNMEDHTIKAGDAAFRRQYFQAIDDHAHLNNAGHNLYLPVAEKFFLENLK